MKRMNLKKTVIKFKKRVRNKKRTTKSVVRWKISKTTIILKINVQKVKV